MSVRDSRNIPADKRNPDFPGSITLVGMMKNVHTDYVIEVSGEWENRPSGNYFPWQFKVSDYSVCEFETPVLLRKFLSELPSVGAEMSGRILAMYPDAKDIIEKYPQKLTAIKGITSGRAEQIRNEFCELKEKRSLGSLLRKYGIKNDEIAKIAENYGTNAMKLIRENPYRLCDDRFLSFKLCDRIGKDFGFLPDAPFRLKTAMNYVLSVKAGSKGHTYLTIEEIKKVIFDDTLIETLADKVMALQEKENTTLPLLHKQYAEVQRGIDNMLNAIQQGIVTQSTKQRLEELEKQKNELSVQMVKEEMAKPTLTKEQIIFWFHRFRKLNPKRLEHRRRLVDSFVNAIYMYDDKMLITFNYKDGTKTIDFAAISESGICSDITALALPERFRKSLFFKGFGTFCFCRKTLF